MIEAPKPQMPVVQKAQNKRQVDRKHNKPHHLGFIRKRTFGGSAHMVNLGADLLT